MIMQYDVSQCSERALPTGDALLPPTEPTVAESNIRCFLNDVIAVRNLCRCAGHRAVCLRDHVIESLRGVG